MVCVLKIIYLIYEVGAIFAVALICASRFGIAFVWLAVPAGWLANFLISYVALRKSWPDDKMAFAAIEDGAGVFIEKYCK